MRVCVITLVVLVGATVAHAQPGAPPLGLSPDPYQPSRRTVDHERQDRLWLGEARAAAAGEPVGHVRGEDLAIERWAYAQLECGLGADRWPCRHAAIDPLAFAHLGAALGALQDAAAARGATSVHAVRCFVGSRGRHHHVWCEGEAARGAPTGEPPAALLARLRRERRALTPPRWQPEVRVAARAFGEVTGVGVMAGARYRDRLDLALRVSLDDDGTGLGADAFVGVEVLRWFHLAVGGTVHRVLGPIGSDRRGELGVVVSPALRLRMPLLPLIGRWRPSRRLDVDGRYGWTFALDDADRARRGFYLESSIGYVF